jgi:TonB family protein
MKKAIISTFVLCLVHFVLFGQEKTPLDKNFEELTDPSSSGIFYRVNPINKKELSFDLIDSTKNKIGTEEWVLDKYSGTVSERNIKLYFPDGMLKKSIIFTDKNRVITDYYENGKKKCVEKYDTGMITSRVHYNENGVYESADKIVKPEAVGGIQAWNSHIRSKLKYPKAALTANAVGLVLVGFDILENGEVENIHIINKGESHPSLEDEAKRMVEIFDKGWIPLTINGISQKSQMTIRINFKRG